MWILDFDSACVCVCVCVCVLEDIKANLFQLLTSATYSPTSLTWTFSSSRSFTLTGSFLTPKPQTKT